MPKLSHKSFKMPSSPIRKLVPYADEAIKRGVSVYHLNIGQPDIHTHEAAISSLHNYSEKIIKYTHSQGTLPYRAAMQEYLAGRKINVNTNQIIVTQGASEALLFILGIIGDYGDEIIIQEPFYANYYGFAQEMGVNVVPILSKIEKDFSLPDINSFEEKITSKTKAILICNPGNPTGYVYSKKELQQLKELVIKHDLFLISDEVYAEFIYEKNEYQSILELEGLEQNSIVVDSESKRFSMCGARVGSIITRNNEVIEQSMKFAQARLSPSEVSQKMATEIHKDCKGYLKEVKAEYQKRRGVLHKKLNEIPGVFSPKPMGAFYCMAELPVDDADKFAKWLLEEFQSNNETIMLAPASGFYSNSYFGKKQVRIAYVLNEEELGRSCEILAEALTVYNSSTEKK